MTDFNTRLIDGYRRFRAYGWREQRDRWEELSRGQAPKIMVIACSDSRVDPSKIFDAAPGEIFVVRNVANLVPPCEADDHTYHGVSAAIEFAVTQLNVTEIIVMGHAACGGVHASLSHRFAHAQPGEGGFIHHWINILDAARQKIIKAHGMTETAQHELELETIRVSLANLQTFPFVRERLASGSLRLLGAYFTIDLGSLHLMDETGEFHPV